ncbi:MAG: hypothetical protein ABH823_01535 [bacterium]
MNSRAFTGRIVKAKEKPIPQMIKREIRLLKSESSSLFNIAAGSCLGFTAGLIVCGMLKFAGVQLGGVEAYLLIGLPSVLGTFTSLVVF